ncbi:MAG TPA: peptidylprolyl isomerase [Bacteroidales bacterium]|nr:peptidylprolyl isomerase [Bacteroidales bacterium]
MTKHYKNIFKTELLILLIIIPFISACKHITTENKHNNVPLSEYEKPLQDVNRYLVKKDNDRIKSFIRRKHWKMKQTQTGLWYQIYERSSDTLMPVLNDLIELSYKVYLLDGTLCYTSDSTGTKKFIVGHGGVEAGLEEAVLMLHRGDKARFIMPPYLAHGLLGDQNKIPARSIIIYNIQLLTINGN